MNSRNKDLDVSQITEYLFISAWPRSDHSKEIHELGIGLVLSMHWMRPSKMLDRPSVKLLWLPSFDFFLIPMPISFLTRGVKAALPVIQGGGKVLTHCRYGIHRSVAMACCVLIGVGYSSGQAMELVKEKRPIADPYVNHIRNRILCFEEHWKK